MSYKSHVIPQQSGPSLKVAVDVVSLRGARREQEDSVGWWRLPHCPGSVFAVVADGLGGHGGGSSASWAAVRAAGRLWAERFHSGSDPDGFLQSWLRLAHREVAASARRSGHPCRTAVAAAVVHRGHAHWVHVGDCRCYHVRDGEILSRTADHSLAHLDFEAGKVGEEEIAGHPHQHLLWQVLGGEETPEPDSGSAPLAAGDALLLCSDGFWENLDAAELTALTRAEATERARTLRRAAREAVRRGAAEADNTSAVLLTCGREVAAPASKVRLGGLMGLAALAAWATAAIFQPHKKSG